MAIFHISFSNISAGKGRSAIASAAYRSGEKLFDNHKKAATIWYLTKKTGSATVLSIATILGMLPMVILSPSVGPMVDRWNKKGLLIFPDVFAACFAIILSVSGTVFHVFPLWLIFISY